MGDRPGTQRLDGLLPLLVDTYNKKETIGLFSVHLGLINQKYSYYIYNRI